MTCWLTISLLTPNSCQVEQLEKYYSAHGLNYIFRTNSLGKPGVKKKVAKANSAAVSTDAEGEEDEEEAPFVDATHVGNFTRFINHSCNPNLKVVSVCTGEFG